jgi:hypothetical protein
VVIDRHRLGYLNPVQKLNCVFCGYGNGVIAYAREITARTEQYWCPIKHALKVKGSHDRYRAGAIRPMATPRAMWRARGRLSRERARLVRSRGGPLKVWKGTRGE